MDPLWVKNGKNCFVVYAGADSQKIREMNLRNKHYEYCCWCITFGAGFVAHWWGSLRNIGHRTVCGLRIHYRVMFTMKMVDGMSLLIWFRCSRPLIFFTFVISLFRAWTIVAYDNEQITLLIFQQYKLMFFYVSLRFVRITIILVF